MQILPKATRCCCIAYSHNDSALNCELGINTLKMRSKVTLCCTFRSLFVTVVAEPQDDVFIGFGFVASNSCEKKRKKIFTY